MLSKLIIAAAFSVLNAVPAEQLTRTFVSNTGWTGGDAAYSVPLTKTKSLWMFGDTFIGRIDKGVRLKMEMVHNSAGWLQESPNGALRMKYFYRERQREPLSLLQPQEGKEYYWPSGMVESSGKLALFCKVVLSKPGDDTGFGFDWISDELLLVNNAFDAPSRWTYSRTPLPGGEAGIKPGAGCMKDGTDVYVYGTVGKQHDVVLMRIPSSDLMAGDISKFEYWSGSTGWEHLPLHPAVLFRGAPELSVSRVEGLPGYWCVYSENGLSPNIMLRHADKPEGPWSEPTVIYRAPEAVRDPKLFCYGAKHHPELAHEPRTLVVTYCLNPGGLGAHRTQPYTYFPKAVTITLTAK